MDHLCYISDELLALKSNYAQLFAIRAYFLIDFVDSREIVAWLGNCCHLHVPCMSSLEIVA
jgi:hypothetical protein